MRYFFLILSTLPIIILALVNIVTQYKMRKITKQRYTRQLVMWLGALMVLVGSFPAYNYVKGRGLFYSSELSFFDIAQTVVIFYLVYAASRHGRKSDKLEQTLRNMHQELSIKLSEK